MNLKFYLEKLHENEIDEENDIDYIKETIIDYLDKADHLFMNDKHWIDCFNDNQLKQISQLIINNVNPIIGYVPFLNALNRLSFDFIVADKLNEIGYYAYVAFPKGKL